MTPRNRILAFGSAGMLIIAGTFCAIVIAGGTAEVVAIVLIGLGLVEATSLVFLEVGLSEDRDLARREASRQSPGLPKHRHKRPKRPTPVGRRLARMRGERRRLG
jgi:hypothetical protein